MVFKLMSIVKILIINNENNIIIHFVYQTLKKCQFDGIFISLQCPLSVYSVIFTVSPSNCNLIKIQPKNGFQLPLNILTFSSEHQH
jgi:hypothetical protein